MAQFARPDGDQSIGSWEDDGAGTTDIFQSIDEVTAVDTDFVRSENDPSTSAYEASLSTVTDPVSSSLHVVRYRFRKEMTGGGQPGTIDGSVTLFQGAVQIANQIQNDWPDATWTAGTFTLTGTQADNITDYSDLRLTFIANKVSGARTSWGEISWAELEVPDVAGAGSPPAAMHSYRQRRVA